MMMMKVPFTPRCSGHLYATPPCPPSLKQLALCHSGVTHQAEVHVAPQLHAVLQMPGGAAHHEQKHSLGGGG